MWNVWFIRYKKILYLIEHFYNNLELFCLKNIIDYYSEQKIGIKLRKDNIFNNKF